MHDSDTSTIPLIVHVIHRLDVGGLENGLVNLINRIPPDRFRHAIICLTDYSSFHRRITRPDVPIFALHKPRGNSPLVHIKLWRRLMQLRPDIVHTRNLGALEGMVSAVLAGVPVRLHSEHGHDIGDIDGQNQRYQRIRRVLRPSVHQYIALSKDLERYLREKVRVPATRIAQLYNGVDTEKFHPAQGNREPLPCDGFAGADQIVIGTVGRMQKVKDPLTLVRAFIRLLGMIPNGHTRVRLVMVGDGPLKEQAKMAIEEAGISSLVWLAGARDDVPRIMRGLDLFVLPSASEGVSNTILEAMASGLPVVATRVGGNPELVQDGVTGTLVPRDDPDEMASTLQTYVDNLEMRRRQGLEARRRVELHFGMDTMVNTYMDIYDKLLTKNDPRLHGHRT